MNRIPFLLALAMAAIVSCTGACTAGPKVRPKRPDAVQTRALVVGLAVRGLEQEALGEYAAKQLPNILAKFDLEPAFEKSLLREVESQQSTFKTPFWVHPETVGLLASSVWGNGHSRPESPQSWRGALVSAAREGNYPFLAVVEAISGGDACFGGASKIWCAPQIRLVVSVVDARGAVVLHTEAVGRGSGAFFESNNNVENLRRALDSAVALLKETRF